MSHKLEDITLYYYPSGDVAKKFTMKQNVVSDLYVHYLREYKPPKTSRISVILSNEDNIKGYFGSILTVDAKFDKDRFWELNDRDQSKTILETVHRIACLCSAEYGWDRKVFEQARKDVLQVDFKFAIEGKKKASKDRQHKASILLNKDEINSTISAVFYDKSGMKIKTVELLKSFQHEIFYRGIIRKYKWFNNREFGLYTSNDQLTIRASLDSDKSKTLIEPKTKDREEIEGILRRITYKEINDQKDLAAWMNR